jgi:uncharacterized delta-60 repeat protein
LPRPDPHIKNDVTNPHNPPSYFPAIRDPRTARRVRAAAGDCIQEPMPAIERLEPRTLLTAGGIDPTFGNGGRATTEIDSHYFTNATAVGLRPDGTLVIAGTRYIESGRAFDLLGLNADGTFDAQVFGNGRSSSYLGPTEPKVVAIQPDGKALIAGDAGDAAVSIIRTDLHGDIDRTFGDRGEQWVDLRYLHAAISTMAVQPDGKILIGGRAVFGDGDRGEENDNDQAILLRLLPNGQIDTSFGDQGYSFFSYGDGTSVRSMAVLPDGAFLIAGRTSGDFYVARINPDGGFDNTFGTDGSSRVTLDLGGDKDEAFALTVLSGGGIVLAGRSNGNFAVARFTPGGSPQSKFGILGKVTIDMGSDTDVARGVIETPDGHLLVIGTKGDPAKGTARACAVRLTARGRLDRTVGLHGSAFLDPPGNRQSLVSQVVAAPGGRAVVVGSVGATNATDAFVVRINPDETLDSTFGPNNDGGGAYPWTPSAYLSGADSAFQRDGKILVVTSVSGQTPGQIVVTRFDVAGTPDPRFGAKGTAFISVPETNYSCFSARVRIAIGAGGRIFVVATQVADDQPSHLFALHPDGSIDQSFGQDGHVDLSPLTGFSDPVLIVDGDRLLLGRAEGSTIALYRFNADGKYDASFGDAGRSAITPWLDRAPPRAMVYVSDIAIAPDGRIVIAGARGTRIALPTTGHTDHASQFMLVRLTTTGRLDPTFGAGGIAITTFPAHPYLGSAVAITILPDGRILAGGTAAENDRQFWGIVASTHMVLARYRRDGSLDPTFGQDGRVVLSQQEGLNLTDLLVLPDDKILAADRGGYGDVALVRLDESGAIDHSFGTGGTLFSDVGYAGSYPSLARLLQLPDGRFIIGGSASTVFAVRFLDDHDPAFAVTIDHEVLHIGGTFKDDRIVVHQNHRTGRIEVEGVEQTFDPSLFAGVEIQGLDGADQIILSELDLPATVNGGNGDDHIFGGRGNDLLQGDAGNDTLFGGQANDTLHGNDGNDYLSGGPGADQLFGDAGNDQLVSLDHATDALDGGPGFDRARGDTTDLLTNVEGILA